jgi:mitochondrial fission protein ELM1
VKQLAWNPLHHLPNFLLGSSLASLDRARSSPLAPPWPDLILDVGKRSVPVARWIKAQSGGSGSSHRARWVHLGRAWAPLSLFDLSIAALQYRPLARANTLCLTAPLHRVTPERLAEAAASWAPRLAHLPRPWHALLVGGDSPPYHFDPATARRLGELANAEVRKSGGALLVTSSGRTRPESAEALFGALDVPTYQHRWQKGAPAADNPYLAYLALADSLIVTGDSASMLAEACSTGKPVALFELPRRPSLAGRLVDLFEQLMGSSTPRKSYRGTPQQQGWLARLFDRLVERGLFMPSRDHAAYHQALIARGLAHRLGEPPPAGPALPLNDRGEAVARIRKLLVAAGEIR